MVLLVSIVSSQAEDTQSESLFDVIAEAISNFFGGDDSEEPIAIKYTESSDLRPLENGRMLLHQYEEGHYTPEDGTHVLSIEAKSLKNSSYWSCSVISDDLVDADCLDYNYTSRKIRGHLSESSQANYSIKRLQKEFDDIPVKVYSYNATDRKAYLNLTKIEKFNITSVDDSFTVTINNVGVKDIIHIGQDSTLIVMNTSNLNGNITWTQIGNDSQVTPRWTANDPLIIASEVGAGMRWIPFNHSVDLFLNTSTSIVHHVNITVQAYQGSNAGEGMNVLLDYADGGNINTSTNWLNFNNTGKLNETNKTTGVADPLTFTMNATSIYKNAILRGNNYDVKFILNTTRITSAGVQQLHNPVTTFFVIAIEYTPVAPNFAPTLSSPAMNYTNATFHPTAKFINASVNFQDANSGDKGNFTVIMFVNNIVDRTMQLPNNYANNTVASIIFNSTNLTVGQRVVVQFNTTDGNGGATYINSSVLTVNNSVPTMSSAILNYTNATLFSSQHFINASVFLNDTDLGDSVNLTAVFFVNNVVNQTIQLLNNYRLNVTPSYIFNYTNVSAGQTIKVQFNGSDGYNITTYLNSTAVTVNASIGIANPTFLTKNQTSTSPVNIYQVNDFINAIVSALSGTPSINATVSVIDSSNNPQINNQSMTNNSYSNYSYLTNFTFNQTGNWVIRTFATASGDLVQSSLTINVSSPFRSLTMDYNATASGGTHQAFFGNLSLDVTGLVGANATIRYNQTNYPVTVSVLNATARLLYSNLTTPIVTTNSVKTFNMTINLDFGSGNYWQINSSAFTQTLTPIGLKACGIGDILAYNFSLYHEVNNTRINGSFEATFFTYPYNINVNQTYTFNMTSQYSFPICLIENSTALRTDALINYYGLQPAVTFDARQHYLVNDSIDNITSNVSLYLLDIASASRVTFSVTDELDTPLAEFIIRAERYDFGTNTYKTVAMGKSNLDGTYLIFLRLDDVFYRISLEQNNTRLYQSDNTQLISTDYTIRLVSNSVSALFEILDNVQVTSPLSFNNGTKTFSVSYQDTSGRATQGCLYITRVGTGQVYNQCSTSNSTTLSYSIGSQTGEFIANFYFKINPSKSLQTLSVVISGISSPDFTESRFFLTLILIVVMAGFGTALSLGTGFEAITTTLVGALMGIYISKGMGLYDMQNWMLIGLTVGVVAIIILVQKAKK